MAGALFEGIDAAGNQGLWVTDGTTAGTHEIQVSGAYSTGVHPQDLTAFKNEVLFAGYDAAGIIQGLWVTDGTAAGTHEITGISGASSGEVDPSNMTVFNNEVLFSGRDAAGVLGLWVTDGTAAGTHEITVNLNSAVGSDRRP